MYNEVFYIHTYRKEQNYVICREMELNHLHVKQTNPDSESQI